MKSRNLIASLGLALSMVNPALAVDVSHKDQVLQLTQKALEQGKQGNNTALVENAKEAQRLATASLRDRHSFIMQSASERLQKAVTDGEKGQLASANQYLEEVIKDITAEGADTMTP